MKKQEQIKEMQIKFSVIDNKTGEYPDLYKIALKEEWAKGLMYCDMEGFSINEDGQIILSDECGKFVYCPSDRFTIVFEDGVVLTNEEYIDLSRNYVGEQIEQTRKKTAKEFAEKLRNKYGKSCSEYYPELIELTSIELDELLKEYEE